MRSVPQSLMAGIDWRLVEGYCGHAKTVAISPGPDEISERRRQKLDNEQDNRARVAVYVERNCHVTAFLSR